MQNNSEKQADAQEELEVTDVNDPQPEGLGEEEHISGDNDIGEDNIGGFNEETFQENFNIPVDGGDEDPDEDIQMVSPPFSMMTLQPNEVSQIYGITLQY